MEKTSQKIVMFQKIILVLWRYKNEVCPPPRSGIEFRGDNEGCVTELSGFKNNILS